jgi:translation initiation factor 3 subunit L
MMNKRYKDAIRVSSSFLNYINRNKRSIPRNFQYANVSKKINQLHGLLSMCLAVQPTRLDDMLRKNLLERCGEEYQTMQKGDMKTFETMFFQCSPRFVTVSPPHYDEKQNSNKDCYFLQLNMFKHEIDQRLRLPETYSYLKLCTKIDIAKLAGFLKIDEDTCIQRLLAAKHKSKQLKFTSETTPAGGEWTSQTDVPFFVDKNLVCVGFVKGQRNFGRYFMSNVLKLEELTDEIMNVK